MLLGWRCPVCDAAGAVPCARCRARLRRAPAVPRIEGVDVCVALLAYSGVGRELVARAKFRNQRVALRWLGEGMAPLAPGPVDVVTWAPANPVDVRRRGFDHGELLAQHIARRLDLRAEGLIVRRAGASLTGQTAAGRRAGPRL